MAKNKNRGGGSDGGSDRDPCLPFTQWLLTAEPAIYVINITSSDAAAMLQEHGLRPDLLNPIFPNCIAGPYPIEGGPEASLDSAPITPPRSRVKHRKACEQHTEWAGSISGEEHGYYYLDLRERDHSAWVILNGFRPEINNDFEGALRGPLDADIFDPPN